MEIEQIIKGHIKELLNQGASLSDARMTICKSCPLFKRTKFGPICNPNLYLNPITNETNHIGGINFEKGCGCRLNAKTRLEDAQCPNFKW